MTTIFGKIVRGEISCKKLFENERILAFYDIAPQAPVHVLIVPKKEIVSLQTLSVEELPLISEIISVAQLLAKKLKIEEGYRLVTNIGEEGGQTVRHLHFHLMGGKKLSDKLG